MLQTEKLDEIYEQLMAMAKEAEANGINPAEVIVCYEADEYGDICEIKEDGFYKADCLTLMGGIDEYLLQTGQR